MAKRKSEADVSADIRVAVETNGLIYQHVEMRPWLSVADALKGAEKPMVLYHPDAFDPDDVEAHRNAAEHLFRGSDRMLGLMARLPEAREAEFTQRAVVAGFRLIDRAYGEEEGYSWLVYKR